MNESVECVLNEGLNTVRIIQLGSELQKLTARGRDIERILSLCEQLKTCAEYLADAYRTPKPQMRPVSVSQR